MSESIIAKKSRLFGSGPVDNAAALRAIRSGEWTARDAAEYRRATSDASKKGGYAERVAGTIRGDLRTPSTL